jgi:hypothetical protein
MKNNEEKKILIENLRKTPIAQFACERSGVSRATFYRWKKEDKKFAGDADKAIAEGVGLINDMAESQLLNAIKDRNLTGIIFWLKNHHQAYTDKLKISGNLVTENKLSEEQEKDIRKALTLAFGINKKGEKNEKNK